jgi:F420-non-reducing hydrogenase small subunit
LSNGDGRLARQGRGASNVVTIAGEWLNSCSGCEIAILNLGEALLELLPKLSIVHMPVLIDNKYCGQTGEHGRLSIPEASVGIVSGGVQNEEHLEVLREMRAKTGVLIALGACATQGGVPAMANFSGMASVKELVYRGLPSTVPGPDPDPESFHLPRTLPACEGLNRHVKVDLALPGCPPHPDYIAETLTALLEGRSPTLPSRAVCDGCPTYRTGSNTGAGLKRMLGQPVHDPDGGPQAMQCLLEQGFMCLGPVTRQGCGGLKGVPRCIAARVPCRGCHGAVSAASLPSADYVGALAAAGLSYAAMPDKPGYLSRFDGGAIPGVNQE